MSLDLGPFTLDRPIGRGAMASVWLGRHRARGVPVAVKVVTAAVDDAAGFRARFAAEVRAVARLDHPGVVRLHDHGELPAGLGEGLPAGAPYLAMELVPGGTLTAMRGRMPWPALRATLLALLDTLAHAHARGIVHRDLKPANVLRAARGPVLTDFGVAFAVDADPPRGEQVMVGTPNYMAPEQIRGDWRAMGPHTDLYALGCLAFALVCGRAPFGGQAVPAIFEAHLRGDWPALRPAVVVPAALEGWIARLAARRASDRFALAADAAIALLALAESPGVEPVEPAPGALEDDLTVVVPSAFVPVDEPTWRAGPGPGGRPPMPETWAEPPRPPMPTPLPGVGRALFALRVPPLVGREAERDRLWAALRAAVHGDGPRAVLVEGPSGLGKSRLVEWLAERVAALGVATPVRVSHGPLPGPDGGLPAAVRRLFRCEGLDGEALLRRVARGLSAAGSFPDRDLAGAIAATMDRDGRFEGADGAIVLGSPRERHAAIAAALARVAAVRPRVLVIDDAQWGADALAFVEHLLDHPARPAVLAAVVVRDDALVAGSAEARLVERLAARAETARIAIGPLPPTEQARLLGARLPLDPAVVDQLVERTAGNPLFGEEVVRHWIRTDALEPGPAGFRPRAGAEATLPDGLRAVWWARLRRVLDKCAPSAAEALELAAVLGMRVDPAEWRAACRRAGLPAPAGLAERLLDDNLLREGDGHFAFVHAMLRETLVARSRARGRFATHNATCADVLAARHEPDPERRARHLLAAGRPAEALPLLMLAIDAHLSRSEYLAARRAMLRGAHALRSLRRSLDAPAWAALRARWSRLVRIEGHPAAALRHARRAAATPVAPIRVRARLAEGIALLGLGRVAEASAAFGAAVHEAERLGEPALLSLALCRAGNGLIWLGRGDEAAALLARSLAVGDDPWPHADALLSMAELTRRRGRPGPAARHGRRALSMYRAAGSRWGMAQALMILGDIDRAVDCVGQAREAYAEARRLCEGIGSGEGALLVDLRDALALLALDRFAEAGDLLDAVDRRADPRTRALVAVYRLPVRAARADWRGFDADWRGLGPVSDGSVAEPDAVFCARRAGALAAAAGQGARAADALALAERQARALGWTTREGS